MTYIVRRPMGFLPNGNRRNAARARTETISMISGDEICYVYFLYIADRFTEYILDTGLDIIRRYAYWTFFIIFNIFSSIIFYSGGEKVTVHVKNS